MALPRALEIALAALAFATSSTATGQDQAPADDARPALAIMGTVPIFWGEAADLAELIGGSYQPHWARAVLERDWRLESLDVLDQAALAGQTRLLLAQPRGLAPQENVALDAWVRAGGQLLLFADPLMTSESRFGLGDRRRPQDVALLSPILAHWGLTLEFDADQPGGQSAREISGQSVPVELPGRLAARGAPGEASCELSGEGVLARCTLGEGRIILLADAALLDLAEPQPGSVAALQWLAKLAYGQDGEITGEPPAIAPVMPATAEHSPDVTDSAP